MIVKIYQGQKLTDAQLRALEHLRVHPDRHAEGGWVALSRSRRECPPLRVYRTLCYTYELVELRIRGYYQIWARITGEGYRALGHAAQADEAPVS